MSVDKELLEAIGQMMDQKLVANNQALRDEMSVMMDEKLKPINERLSSVEKNQADQTEFERGTRVLVEGIGKNIKLLAEAHGANASKLQQLDRMEMTVNDVKSDTEVIKDVVSWHSGDLQRLKKA